MKDIKFPKKKVSRPPSVIPHRPRIEVIDPRDKPLHDNPYWRAAARAAKHEPFQPGTAE